MCATLLAPEPEDPTSTILELDELWSFELIKPTTSGCGLPSVSRRGMTCQRLWKAIPEGYRQGYCITDFWAVYAAVIPEEKHIAVVREIEETAMSSAGILRCASDWPVLCT